MAYTHTLIITKAGGIIEWEIDPNSGNPKIKANEGFECCLPMFKSIRELLIKIFEIYTINPNIVSIEYKEI